jgi:hypothetical protein
MLHYYAQNQVSHNNCGSQLLSGTLRHNNAEGQGMLSRAEKVEAWLEVVSMHTEHDELMDPEAVGTAPSDVWSEPSVRGSNVSER